VPFSDDAELLDLFRSEIAERSARLVEGARACVSGATIDRARANDLYREGHTVKGTARMMGFTAIADAGKLLEETWKGVHDGEVTMTPTLAGALAQLAAGLEPAVSADPHHGPPVLAEALRTARLAVSGGAPVEAVETTSRPQRPVENADLGGLLGSIDAWAFGENVRVNAAGLFRLINEVCSLRVDAGALRDLVDEVTAALGDSDAITSSLARLADSVAAAEKTLEDLQARALDLASSPLSEITNTYPQLVRYLARKAGKEIRFELVGDHHAVDRLVLDGLSDPLRQLLVNAVEHGVEPIPERVAAGKPPTATLSVRASVEQNRLRLVVEDDGRGVDWDAVRTSAIRRGLLPARRPAEDDLKSLHALLFTPGFSTALPSELVGDGSGLAKVLAAAESLRGSVVLESETGQGTRVIITVPTSRSLQDVVLVRAAGQIWGIPEIAVLDTLPAPRGEATPATVVWQEAPLPLVAFAEAVGLVEDEPLSRVVVASTPAGPVGLLVAGEIGRRQVAARELGALLDGAPQVTGAALLGGGDVVVLVDPAQMAERSRLIPEPTGPRPRVLVVDDSRGVRQVVGQALGLAGFDVDLAGSPTEALSALAGQRYDAIVMDYVMPTMDGASLVRKIRGMGIVAPVVVMSGQATEKDRARAVAAGADAYFDKNDVRRGALAAALRNLVAGRPAGGGR
jgi:two-component system, chemotaxis family, sensor kinase CheA